MILDKMLEFSSAQAAFASGADVVSTNIYDTGAVGVGTTGASGNAYDVGIGETLFVFAKTVAAVTGGTSIQVVVQDSADGTTGWTDKEAGPVVPVASATANAVLAKIRLPIGLRRYIRLAYRNVGANAAGTVSSWINKDVEALQYGASGFTVA